MPPAHGERLRDGSETMIRSFRLFALSLALLPAACGSSEPSQTMVVCQSGQFRLVGTPR